MPPKSVRYEAEVALYREHDFLTAYGKHTDKRIVETGYKAAIGGGENWNEHGELQRDFLILCGMKPWHRLLDIGCGTGRLARKVVPYLDSGHYLGIDISHDALASSSELSRVEGWAERSPVFSRASEFETVCQKFDYLWSFSVMIHLPYSECVRTLKTAASVMHAHSRLYFSYVPEKISVRSGLKQFRKTQREYESMADEAGLAFTDVPDWIERVRGESPRWAGSQRVALASIIR